ncbi:TPA: hypothetical protein DCW61_04000 [Candidatus Uhrbacteria bacterium]|nr:hypothetical protein [Candidatus Uhrbacteria bacterium]
MTVVTRRTKIFLLTAICLSSLWTPASAHETSDTDSKIIFAMNGGFTGLFAQSSWVRPYMAQDSWVRQYVYAGPSAYISLRENVVFIPSLTFEVAPGAGNWGFVATGRLELILSKGHFAIDLVPSISQDTTPYGTTTVSWSMGPGATYSFLNGMTISWTFQVSKIFGHPEAGVILQPTLNFGILIR